MPVRPEWKRRVEAKIKPYGKAKWTDVAIEKVREAAAGREGITVLDVGCGIDSWIIRTIRETCPSPRVIGVDVDPDCVKNPDVDVAHLASAEDMPLESGSVDLVLSAWVAEHLENPVAAIREMNRVLKPGGAIIFWTPNLYNPAMLVSKCTPRWFHTWSRRLSHGADHAENAPTYYRMNTIRGIKELALGSGLVCEYIRAFSSGYQYFGMSKPTYVAACLLNKLAVVWPLSCLRLTLLCVIRKPELLIPQRTGREK